MHEAPSLLHMVTVANGVGKSVKEVFGVDIGSGQYEEDKCSPEDFDKLIDVMNSVIPPADRALVWLRASGVGWIKLRKRLNDGSVSEIKLRYKYALRNIYLEVLRISG